MRSLSTWYKFVNYQLIYPYYTIIWNFYEDKWLQQKIYLYLAYQLLHFNTRPQTPDHGVNSPYFKGSMLRLKCILCENQLPGFFKSHHCFNKVSNCWTILIISSLMKRSWRLGYYYYEFCWNELKSKIWKHCSFLFQIYLFIFLLLLLW